MDVEKIGHGYLTFQHESASAYIDFFSIDLGMVTNVYATMRGLGDGTGLMRAICAYADENDMQLLLYVGADEEIEDGLDDTQLISWYERFGFKLGLAAPDNAPQMVRQPWRETFGNWSYDDSLSKESNNGTQGLQQAREFLSGLQAPHAGERQGKEGQEEAEAVHLRSPAGDG